MKLAGAGKAGRLRWLAGVIAAVGLAAVVAAAWLAGNAFIKARHKSQAREMLMPNSLLPRTDAEWKAQADTLVARYPHDPRPRLFRGMTMLDAGDFAGAERELRAGLADMDALKDLLPRQVDTLVRTNLAIALNSDNKADEARTVAAPVCRLDTPASKPMRTRLQRIGVCD